MNTRVHNREVIECQIELTIIVQIPLAEGTAVFEGKFIGKHLDYLLTIFRPVLSMLLFLDDFPSNVPESQNGSLFNGCVCIAPSRFDESSDGIQKIPIRIIVLW